MPTPDPHVSVSASRCSPGNLSPAWFTCRVFLLVRTPWVHQWKGQTSQPALHPRFRSRCYSTTIKECCSSEVLISLSINCHSMCRQYWSTTGSPPNKYNYSVTCQSPNYHRASFGQRTVSAIPSTPPFPLLAQTTLSKFSKKGFLIFLSCRNPSLPGHNYLFRIRHVCSLRAWCSGLLIILGEVKGHQAALRAH